MCSSGEMARPRQCYGKPQPVSPLRAQSMESGPILEVKPKHHCCASTLKVRKTTVRPGPGAWTRQCLRATPGTKRTYVTENLPIPHPKHNCRNRALEHSVQANFSKF